MFQGSGQDSVDLRVPQGRAPKVLEKVRWVGLAFIRTIPDFPPRGSRSGTLILGVGAGRG